MAIFFYSNTFIVRTMIDDEFFFMVEIERKALSYVMHRIIKANENSDFIMPINVEIFRHEFLCMFFFFLFYEILISVFCYIKVLYFIDYNFFIMLLFIFVI